MLVGPNRSSGWILNQVIGDLMRQKNDATPDSSRSGSGWLLSSPRLAVGGDSPEWIDYKRLCRSFRDLAAGLSPTTGMIPPGLRTQRRNGPVCDPRVVGVRAAGPALWPLGKRQRSDLRAVDR